MDRFGVPMAVGIKTNNLVKVFGETRAVDGVDLDIQPGEIFFLLGPSGCGKTTLLRCLAGFNVPDDGTVHIGDRDVTNLAPHERDTGMVFQSYALWPHMSVVQNVAFGLEMRKISKDEIKKRVGEALEMVQMTDRATFKPNQLSGGQQQRVALARALVIHPKCLLLDEPLSNLDAKLRLEMRTEIRRICKEAGLTAVYVTHDQKEALSVADRIAILSDGKLQQVDVPEGLYRKPVSRFVADFIGETNFVKGEVTLFDEASVNVRTPMGTVISSQSPPERLELGQEVTLSIRPEILYFNDPPSGSLNIFNGAVHDSVYLGEMAQHQVKVPALDSGYADGFVRLKAFDLNPKIVAREGSAEVQLWFAPEDVVVLAK